MKKSFLLFLIVVLQTNAQSWQWGKRGGSTDALNSTGDLRPEEVYGIVTDSNKNIYVLSAVGKNGLDVDGVTKTNYGDGTQVTDVMLASFACDGTYRWSKVIGGNAYDRVNSIQIDNQDNIYIAGKFGTCGDVAYPPRIDDDVILPQNPIDCSVVFLAKYNSNGVLQWFKRPQPAGTSNSDGLNQTFSKGFATDILGNSYWLLLIPPGTYADGAFVNTQSGINFHLFKYDTTGNFISATPIDMQLSTGYSTTLQFIRNPYNNYFYMTSIKTSNTNTAVVGGQTITHTAFLTCFNDLGQFQWVREDTATTLGKISFYNLAFDSENNIYLGGRMTGLSSESFLGFIIPETLIPGFIMKVNPTATSLLWSSYNNTGTLQRGAIALNGNEIGFTSYCFGTNFTWGSQVLNANAPGTATEVLLARFNKDTGACIALSKIPGDDGYDDAGTALAVDASGDYILGGGCGHQLTFATNSITTIGSQSDFFVAKYSTAPCISMGVEEFNDEGLEFYPNPSKGLVSIKTYENLNYRVFTLTGALVLEGKLTEAQNGFSVNELSKGCYILQTTNDEGVVKSGKLVRE